MGIPRPRDPIALANSSATSPPDMWPMLWPMAKMEEPEGHVGPNGRADRVSDSAKECARNDAHRGDG